MNISEAYSIYTALRLHFTTNNYDIRSGVKPRKPKNGVKPKMQMALEKVLRKYPTTEQYVEYIMSNFLYGDKWGGLYTPEGPDVYLQWTRVQESMTYTYRSDVEKMSLMVNSIDELWNCKDGHPLILKLYLGKTCSLETLVILNKLYKFSYVVDEQLLLDPVWSQVSTTLHKYSPFVRIDKDKFSMITSKVFYE
jgi:hypothetical protein